MAENLFNNLRAFFLFQRFAGSMFFAYKKDEGFIITTSEKVRLVIYAIFQTIWLFKLGELYLHSYDIYLVVSSTMERTACIVYSAFDCLFNLTECLLNKFYNNKILKILNGFLSLHEQLGGLGIKIEYTFRGRWLWVLTLYASIELTHMLTLIYADYKSVGDLNASLYRCAIFFYSCVRQLALTTTFVNTTIIVRDILRALNNQIQHCLEENVRNDLAALKKMEYVRKIYQDLFKLLRKFNSALSLRILFMFAMIFTWFTLMVFNFITVIVASKYALEYRPIMYYCFGAMLHCIVLFASYILAAEIYRKEVMTLKILLLKAMNQLQNEQLKKEINVLTLQIIHEKYEITIAGFFAIDLKLLASVVAAITMYTIVLMQYNPKAGFFKESMHKHLI